ncbi:MAG: cyclase [Actinomycetia bacterium]|nr:cyclase [Actinomycetes bacterium]
MVTLFIRHDVEDYSKWRQGYDENVSVRTAGAVQADTIYRSVENGNNLTVSHDFDSIDAARAFAGSGELKAAMAALGVVGHPDIWFVEKA